MYKGQTFTILLGDAFLHHVVFFLAALVALYLTLVSESLSDSLTATLEFLTQRVTFETWDPSDI